MKKYDEKDGVWRTIGGRRVFIKDGQSLSDAMKESGKFKGVKTSKETSQEFKKEHLKEVDFNSEEYEKSLNKYMTEHGELGGKQGGLLIYNSDEEEFYKAKLKHDKEYLKVAKSGKEVAKAGNEYDLYKKAIENPDSIDPMTENSTDWEALDKKYKSKYEAENYYSKLSQYQTREDLDTRKYKLDNNLYDESKRKEYEEFYKQGEAYYQKKYGSGEEDVYVSLRDPDTGARETMKWSEAKKIADKSFKENQEKIKNLMPKYLIPKEETETGYQTYLKDTQGTTNEELINVGREKENRVDYQKYKNEVIRNINQKRMEKGVTNMETAYKRAYEEYKKLHPRTKLTLQDFIRMSEE